LLARPRTLKPQTQRQLSRYLSEHSAEMVAFLADAASQLEEHELDILFAPQFTPQLDDQAAVSDLLFHWQPTQDELDRLVPDLCAQVGHTVVQLSDDAEAKLTLHEVMVERFVRLLHLQRAPAAEVSASMREATPSELWPVATALLRRRGFTPTRQAWFARFVNHMASRHPVDQAQLEAAAQFIADQPTLEGAALAVAAEAMVRAAVGSAAYAQGGRAYWSPDVAQHHDYHGQGQVDQDLVNTRQEEAELLKVIEEDLKTFGDNEQ
jgi:hypothetical protein